MRQKEREREKGVPGEKGGQKSERPSYLAARTRREKRERKKEDETVAVVAEAGGTVLRDRKRKLVQAPPEVTS